MASTSENTQLKRAYPGKKAQAMAKPPQVAPEERSIRRFLSTREGPLAEVPTSHEQWVKLEEAEKERQAKAKLRRENK